MSTKSTVDTMLFRRLLEESRREGEREQRRAERHSIPQHDIHMRSQVAGIRSTFPEIDFLAGELLNRGEGLSEASCYVVRGYIKSERGEAVKSFERSSHSRRIEEIELFVTLHRR